MDTTYIADYLNASGTEKGSRISAGINNYNTFPDFIPGHEMTQQESEATIACLESFSNCLKAYFEHYFNITPHGGGFSIPVSVQHDIKSSSIEKLLEHVPDTGLGNIFTMFKDTDYESVLMHLFVVFSVLRITYNSRTISIFHKMILGLLTLNYMYKSSTNVLTYLNFWSSTPDYDEGVPDLDMEIMPHSNLEQVELFSSMVLSGIHALTGIVPKNHLVRAIVESTKVTDNQRSNVSSMIMLVFERLSKFLSNFGHHDLAEYFEIDAITDPDVKDYHSNVTTFLSQRDAGLSISDEDFDSSFAFYTLQGKKLLKGLRVGSFDHKMTERLLTELARYRKDDLGNRFSLNGTRPEPIGVLLMGPPGIFKTVASQRIITCILPFICPKEFKDDVKNHYKNFVYPAPIDKFFDGYSNRNLITIIDDFACVRDVAGATDSDGSKIIRMINTSPYPLPMANASEKNKTFFRSLVVLASTNLTSFDKLESMTDYKAVRRRFTIRVNVSKNPKYENIELPEDEEGYTTIPDDVWIFSVSRYQADKLVSEDQMSFSDLASEIVISVKKSQMRHITNMAASERSRVSVENDIRKALVKEFGEDIDISPHGMFDFRSKSPDFLIDRESTSSDDTDHSYASDYRDNYYDLIEKSSQKELDRFSFRLSYYFTMQHDEMGVFGSATTHKIAQIIYDNQYPFGEHDTLNDLQVLLRRHFDGCREKKIDPFTGISIQPSDAETLLDKVKNVGAYLLNFLRKRWKELLIFLGISVFVVGIVKYFLGMFVPKDENILSNVQVGVKVPRRLKDKYDYTPHGHSLNGVKMEQLPKFTASDLGDKNASNDVISRCLRSYSFTFYLCLGNFYNTEVDYIRMGLAHNVVGNIFMFNLHFVPQIVEKMKDPSIKGAQVILLSPTRSNMYSIALDDFLANVRIGNKASDHDVCFVSVKSAQRNSIGMLQYFIKECDIPKVMRQNTVPANLLTVKLTDPASNIIMMKSQTVRFSHTNSVVVKENWTGNGGSYMLDDLYSYSGTGFGSGDCGSILYLSGGGVDNRILLGIHAAGNAQLGFATALTQEMLLNYLKDCQFELDVPFTREVPLESIGKLAEINCQGNMKPVLQIRKELAPSHASSSEFTKSIVYNKLEGYPHSTKTISRVKPYVHEGRNINPSEQALKNFGFFPPAIPEKFVVESVMSYSELINVHMNVDPIYRKDIPIEEALSSFGSVRGVDPTTSAGWPYNTPSSSGNLKKEYFKTRNKFLQGAIDNDVYSKSLMEVVDKVKELERKILDGERQIVLYTGNLKDEKQTKEKAITRGPRFFTGVGFDMFILFRKKFGSFLSAYCQANLSVGSAVGVNPYSLQWNNMALLLSAHSQGTEEFVGAGDYTAFDGHQCPLIMNAVLDIINEWYNDKGSDDYIVRCRMWSEITNSRSVFEGLVYEWNVSMPSGNPLTTLINTMANNLYFRIAWQCAGYDAKLFNGNVYLCCLGDDNIFSVKERYREKFNELVMPDLMNYCGMVYTTELKEKADRSFRKLTEVEFLKRSFTFNHVHNRWMAPLRENSILESIYWTKKKHGETITKDSISAGLLEMTLHGQEAFERFAGAIRLVKNRFSSENQGFNFDYVSSLQKTLKLDKSLYF